MKPAMSDRVALVTGASKGLGRHFALALAASGMRVVAVARPSAELEELASDAILTVGADITDPRAIESAVDQAIKCFGRLDVFVGNAAIYFPFSFETASDADIQDHFAVNVLGLAWGIRAVIPHLRETRGQIVAISSESVRAPFPMLATYAASKSAVETLCHGLRDELRGDGIRVTVLRSGAIRGGNAAAGWPPERADAFFKKIVATGHAAMAGDAASPESMAEALLAVLALPEDVGVDLIEVRAARPGMPERAAAAAGSVA
jgi:NAD(P)-dependent dehydrogenase (short-subunit alcohol dehydrogenase family)